MTWAAALCCVAVQAETIKVAGTGASTGTLVLLGAEFARASPGDRLVVVHGLGASGGMKAMLAAAVDMAAITRPLSPAEVGQGLTAVEYGRTPFLIATNKSIGRSDLSAEAVRQLYSGERANWEDGSPVRLVLRPLLDSDTQHLAKFSTGMQAVLEAAIKRPGVILAATDQEAADAIERTPGGIGTSTLALLLSESRKVNVMSFRGAAPTTTHLTAGSYPHFKTLFLAHRRPTSHAVERFLKFVASDQGKAILLAAGHAIDNAGPSR